MHNAALINFSWISGHAPASLLSSNSSNNSNSSSAGDEDINGNESGVMVCECRVRYRSELVGCDVMLSSSGDGERRSEKEKKKEIFVRFHEPQKAVASGQILVLYDNDVCLGGGTIL